MKINVNKPNKPNKASSGEGVSRGGGVVISQNIQKESERLDKHGNVIDPRTKQVIKKANEQ